jgi:apolipoprotein N-acyltransferase
VRSLLSSIKAFFWPRDNAVRLRRAELTFWAFVLALAYLPLPLGFLAWIALVRPLAIISSLDGKTAFKAAYFFALLSNIFQLYWVAVVTPPGMVAAVFILALYPAFILYLFVKIYRWKKVLGLIALPFLWVGMEYFRSLSQYAFPWTDLSYSQGYYLTFIQIVSVIGCYGLSFALILMNLFIWQAMAKVNRLETRVSCGIAFLFITILIYLYGWVVFPPYIEPGNFRVSLLQGNVDLNTKWSPGTREYNFALYDSLAQEASRDSADLIVWPETAAPCYPRLEPKYRQILSNTVANSRAYNLIGAMDNQIIDEKERSYNAAFQFAPDGTMGISYNKVKLVPFSEHAPYEDYMPFLTRDFLAKYLTLIRNHDVEWWSDFYPGDSAVVFHTDKGAYSVLICFESAFPEYVRECVHKGAEFMVNITNDTWFGRSSGPFQHMRIAVFRAVENRIWLARCANSGISALIDPYGRETARAGLYVRKVVSGRLALSEEESDFTKIGPVFGSYSLLITTVILFIMITLWIWKKVRR